jgi:hypothetical protein
MLRCQAIGLVVLALVCSTALEAQQSADELAQKAANPIADLMSIPF